MTDDEAENFERSIWWVWRTNDSLRRLTSCFDTSEDAVQEALLWLLQYPPGPDVAVTTAAYKALFWATYKQSKKVREFEWPREFFEELYGDHQGFTDVDNEDEAAFLAGKFPAKTWEIFKLRQKGLKFREIATRLGVSRQNVEQTLSRTLARLRRYDLGG